LGEWGPEFPSPYQGEGCPLLTGCIVAQRNAPYQILLIKVEDLGAIAFQMRNFKFKMRQFRFETWNFEFQTRNFKLETKNFELET
jgi:hypothetical protein